MSVSLCIQTPSGPVTIEVNRRLNVSEIIGLVVGKAGLVAGDIFELVMDEQVLEGERLAGTLPENGLELIATGTGV